MGNAYGKKMKRIEHRRGPYDTPNLAALAKRSGTHAFVNAHCPVPTCSPSRTAVLTGLRPDTSRVYDNRAIHRCYASLARRAATWRESSDKDKATRDLDGAAAAQFVETEFFKRVSANNVCAREQTSCPRDCAGTMPSFKGDVDFGFQAGAAPACDQSCARRSSYVHDFHVTTLQAG